MQIESREKHIKRAGNRFDRSSDWSEWVLCEGTNGLTQAECTKFAKDWTRDDRVDTPWLRVEYRVVPSFMEAIA